MQEAGNFLNSILSGNTEIRKNNYRRRKNKVIWTNCTKLIDSGIASWAPDVINGRIE